MVHGTAANLTTTAHYPPRHPHDGWTGEKMAIFCETLAETAVVADACAAAGMGISGAYAARRRNPVFAAAWDSALSIARERLADTLLARSMEGNVEQIYRDGELVGERRFIDNRLGLQILRRLDRLADFPGGGPLPRQRQAAASHPIDWTFAIDALRTGDDEGVARALALIEDHEVEEVEGDWDFPDEEGNVDLSDRCWFDDAKQVWMTDFPPPAEFDGYESCPYDADSSYVRACTVEEAAILEADRAADRASERAEEDALRDAWFKHLKSDMRGYWMDRKSAEPPA